MDQKPAFVRLLTILHYALLIGQVLFAIILFSVVYFGNFAKFSLEELSGTFLGICITLGLAAFLGGKFLFDKKLEAISNSSGTLNSKSELYRGTCISRWAVMEGVTLFSLVIFFMTGNYWIISVAIVMILLFFTLRPTTDKIAEDLKTTVEELYSIK